MPSAVQIAGWAPGMVDKHSNPEWAMSCYNQRCKDQYGHEQWECPELFARTFPGRVLPGWKNDGTKDATGWDGNNEPTAATRQAWAALVATGFFKNNPYSANGSPHPDPSRADGAGG